MRQYNEGDMIVVAGCTISNSCHSCSGNAGVKTRIGTVMARYSTSSPVDHFHLTVKFENHRTCEVDEHVVVGPFNRAKAGRIERMTL